MLGELLLERVFLVMKGWGGGNGTEHMFLLSVNSGLIGPMSFKYYILNYFSYIKLVKFVFLTSHKCSI